MTVVFLIVTSWVQRLSHVTPGSEPVPACLLKVVQPLCCGRHLDSLLVRVHPANYSAHHAISDDPTELPKLLQTSRTLPGFRQFPSSMQDGVTRSLEELAELRKWKEYVSESWYLVAKAVDRFFFWIFFIVTISMHCVIFILLPLNHNQK